MKPIASRQHSVVRRFRDLADRRSDTAVLVDGDHLVAEALDAGVPLETVLADGRAGPLARRAEAAGADVYEAPASVVAAARPVHATGGIVAIARWRPAPIADAFEATPAFIVGLVDVQDPGNVGSAIRSADAIGATGVVALGDSADPGGWKALRGAMGSTFRVPVARGSVDDALTEARRRGVPVAATVADGGTPLDAADLTGPMLVLVGNEGSGLPEAVVALANQRITIPMRAGVNSLNVSVTAALVLWERRRQIGRASSRR